MLKFFFFFSFFIVLYSYVGYGLLIFILIKLRSILSGKKVAPNFSNFEPEVTLVIAAFNEAGLIEEKIKNCLELDYPRGKLNYLFITDGSSDETPEIIRKYSNIQLLHHPERRGKVAAMNRAVKYVKTPYIIFNDANTLLNKNCVREILKHYQDPRVGGVAGEKKIIESADYKASGAGEGFYWRYESFLKKLDSEFYSVVGAAGELFSVKTSLFHEAAEDTIIEDFVQSLQICMTGYVIRYEPNAIATESASPSMKDEQKRKVRIAAGAFQAMLILKDLLNVFRYPSLSFLYISHRVLRWTLCPLSLLIFLISNILLVSNGGTGKFYLVVLLVQSVFYVMAGTGWLFAGKNVKIKAFFLPYYFFFMNLSVFMGFFRFIRKKQSVLWDKAARPLNP